jgi:menaquinone-dependent protoporphyrinogen oxidase
MSSFLIIYSSTDGHTKIICERITNFLNDGNLVKLLSLEEAKKIDLSNFEKIIIGASIRYGKHSKELYKFINLNKNILDQKKSAFFSVNVVARKPEKNTAETNPYINKFLKMSKWKPNIIRVFAGKVDYPNYNFFDKYIIKFIMFITKGPTDTSQSYEFTEWSKVDDFSEELKNNY